MENESFVSASIKYRPYKKLTRLSKNEKHTISDQLSIILKHYSKSKKGDNS